MMKTNRFSLIFLSGLLLAGAAFGQTAAENERADRCDAIVAKIDKLNVLNQILPIVMTKEQIRKLLPAIEKARQKVRDTQKAEFEDLTKFDGRADAALSAAINKGSVPTQAQLDEFSALFGALRMRRTQVAEENAENVCTVLMGILNAGQTKAASNQLNPKRFNPDIKVEELKTEDKVRIYCREVLLHPLAYDLLVKMSK